MSVLRIVLAADPAYFPGLAVSMASALAFLGKGMSARITVLHSGLGKTHHTRLSAMAERLRPGTSVDMVDVHTLGTSLPAAPGLHPLTYARLLATSVVEEPAFVYLDSDLLVMRDITPLVDMLAGSTIAAAPRAGRLGDDCPWLDPATMNPDDDYFCAGILAVDRLAWLREDISGRSLAIATREPQNCRYHDQTVLNFLLHGRTRFLDPSWGWNHWEFERAPSGAPLILHYITGGKPWRAPSRQGVAGLWVEAFRLLCLPEMPGSVASCTLSGTIRDLAARFLGAIASGPLAVPISQVSKRTADQWSWQARRVTQASAQQPRIASCLQLIRSALLPC
ncbi:MAG: hypothetical protein Fur0032_01920 [Terrimicrobiaceae bacterium]